MIDYQDESLTQLTLGKIAYATHYQPALLQAVPRKLNREQLGILSQQPLRKVLIFGHFMKFRG